MTGVVGYHMIHVVLYITRD